MVHNLGNRSWDINTAVLPPSSRRLNSIRGTIYLYITDSTFPSKQRDPWWGFRNLPAICRPQDRLFLFFTRHGRRAPGFVTTAALCSTSHTHPPPAGGATAGLQRAWATPQVSPQQSFTRFTAAQVFSRALASNFRC